MVFLACSLLTAAALIYTLYVRPEHLPQEPATEPELDYLNEKKKVVYENLRDLNLEYRMEKLSDADYAQLKAHFQRELAAVMKEMDVYAAGRAFAAATESPSDVRTPAESTCARCGRVNPACNRFCGECGAPLASSVS